MMSFGHFQIITGERDSKPILWGVIWGRIIPQVSAKKKYFNENPSNKHDALKLNWKTCQSVDLSGNFTF